MNYKLLLFSTIILATSCKKEGCTDPSAINFDVNAKKDDGSCEYPAGNGTVTLQFDHFLDNNQITDADFNNLSFTNDFGTTFSITKMTYLISDLTFHTANGDSVVTDDYFLVDMSNSSSLSVPMPTEIPQDTYSHLSFRFGFDSDDNISGAYNDLNTASWSWPEMLGGGYHYLKFEGKFVNLSTDTVSYAYHMGVAREITPSDTNFYNNSIYTKLTNISLPIESSTTLKLRMDIDKWFNTPNDWDLNTYGSMLMPNYDAQILMNAQGRDVIGFNGVE